MLQLCQLNAPSPALLLVNVPDINKWGRIYKYTEHTLHPDDICFFKLLLWFDVYIGEIVQQENGRRAGAGTTFFLDVPDCYRKAWSFSPCNPDQSFLSGAKERLDKEGPFHKSRFCPPDALSKLAYCTPGSALPIYSLRVTRHCALRTQRSNS